MKAIIDETRLPNAVSYYRMFPFEPAKIDDINITQLIPIRSLTLHRLLTELNRNPGDDEFLIVLHSEPFGLVLPVGGGIPRTADGTVLRLLRFSYEAFFLRDHFKDTSSDLAWMLEFFEKPDQPIPISSTAGIHQERDVVQKCKRAKDVLLIWLQESCKLLSTDMGNLRRITDLARTLRRIEFRSCQLGAADRFGLTQARLFFAGSYASAPRLRTFYVPRRVTINNNQTELNQLARNNLQNPRRLFASTGHPARENDDVSFAISVRSGSGSSYAVDMVAISNDAVRRWVERYVCRNSGGFQNGRELVVSGFWTDNPNNPFIFPLEPEYKNQLVCNR